MAYTNTNLIGKPAELAGVDIDRLAAALVERLVPVLLEARQRHANAPENNNPTNRPISHPEPKPLPVTDASRARAVRWLKRKGRL